MPGLQAVDSGHCSCHPEEKRTVKSRENCTSLVGIWGQLRQMREKAMATHSSTLAWKIPWTEEPGVLQSMGSLRVGHD